MYHKDLFKNKVVLVTGGRSGIGFAIAKMMLELGAQVIICSRKTEPLQQAALELSKIAPCAAKSCDIRKTEEVAELAQFIKKAYGRLDILVNNAGGQFPSLAEFINEKGWNAVINNNLNGTFYMISEMAKSFFIPQKQGNIVNIVVDLYRGFPGMVHTGAARAGIENMSKTLAVEWADYNIRINCLAPGTIESSGLETYPDPIKEQIEKGKQEIPMRRFGTVEEVANAVCFLASPLASYTSGVTLYVDGANHLNGDKMGLVKVIKSLL